MMYTRPVETAYQVCTQAIVLCKAKFMQPQQPSLADAVKGNWVAAGSHGTA